MARNSQQRRANNKRLAHQSLRNARSAQGPKISFPDVTTPAQLGDLVVAAACFAYGSRQHEPAFERSVQQLADLEARSDTNLKPTAALFERGVQAIESLYEMGWQPLDIAHAVRRTWTQRGGRLVIAMIASQARRSGAAERAPQQWLAQLSELGIYDHERGAVVGGHGQSLKPWANAEKIDVHESIATAAQVLGVLLMSPRQSVLVDPPSAWGNSNRGVRAARQSHAQVDPKALKLIRALLAKAEATTFEAEADAFSAKAQDMMTRYSIDAAVLASAAARDGGAPTAGVESRRVHIEHPYAEEKAGLLSVIADVNGVRAVWSPQIGASTIMGFPVDLQLSELLYTSLLFQATRASSEATAHDRSLRTASFRRAFLVAFADRIAERLRTAQERSSTAAQQQYGAALVPVLAQRQAAVDAAYEAAFPHATTMRSRKLNAYGWYAGRAAADLAKIGSDQAITAG